MPIAVGVPVGYRAEMSSHDDEALDPYAAPRVASAPHSDEMRVVSEEAEHVALVRRIRRLAIVTSAWTLAFGLTNMAFAGAGAVVFMTEKGGVSWATLALPTAWSLLGTMMLISAAQALNGAYLLMMQGKAPGSGIAVFPGGWLFSNAGLGIVSSGCLAFLWAMHAFIVKVDSEPAHSTADILWSAFAFVLLAAIVYFLLLSLARPAVRRMQAAGLSLHATVDEEGRVVVRRSKEANSAESDVR